MRVLTPFLRRKPVFWGGEVRPLENFLRLPMSFVLCADRRTPETDAAFIQATFIIIVKYCWSELFQLNIFLLKKSITLSNHHFAKILFLKVGCLGFFRYRKVVLPEAFQFQHGSGQDVAEKLQRTAKRCGLGRLRFKSLISGCTLNTRVSGITPSAVVGWKRRKGQDLATCFASGSRGAAVGGRIGWRGCDATKKWKKEWPEAAGVG